MYMDLRTKIDLYVSVIGKNFDEESKTLLRNSYNVIAKQARNEYKKELLKNLPQTPDHTRDYNPTHIKDEMYCCLDCEVDKNFNDCLSEVRNIISKPNI